MPITAHPSFKITTPEVSKKHIEIVSDSSFLTVYVLDANRLEYIKYFETFINALLFTNTFQSLCDALYSKIVKLFARFFFLLFIFSKPFHGCWKHLRNPHLGCVHWFSNQCHKACSPEINSHEEDETLSHLNGHRHKEATKVRDFIFKN